MKKIEKFKKKYVLTFPEEILNDPELKTTDRFLLSIVIAFDGPKGCFATNKSLAKILNCSVGAVSNCVKKLVSLGYIVSNEKNEGRGNVRRVPTRLKIHKLSEDDIITERSGERFYYDKELDELILIKKTKK